MGSNHYCKSFDRKQRNEGNVPQSTSGRTGGVSDLMSRCCDDCNAAFTKVESIQTESNSLRPIEILNCFVQNPFYTKNKIIRNSATLMLLY